ncbi:unnamed protein product, partial [Clonostachys rosea]
PNHQAPAGHLGTQAGASAGVASLKGDARGPVKTERSPLAPSVGDSDGVVIVFGAVAVQMLPLWTKETLETTPQPGQPQSRVHSAAIEAGRRARTRALILILDNDSVLCEYDLRKILEKVVLHFLLIMNNQVEGHNLQRVLRSEVALPVEHSESFQRSIGLRTPRPRTGRRRAIDRGFNCHNFDMSRDSHIPS